IVYDVKRSPASHEQHTTLSAHPFMVDLPPGKYTFTAEHGKEHTIAVQKVTVSEAGEIPDVKLSLVPWIEMHKLHWYSGDTHVHRKVAEVPNLVEAEDLHVALPLTYWVRAAYEAPGQMPVDRHPEAKPIVVESRVDPVAPPIRRVIWPVNTEYELFTVNGKAHTEGAVFVLNHKTPLRPAAPPVIPVAQAAREQGALLDLDKHTWNWTPMIVPLMNVDLFELANNHVWRTGFLFKNWTLDVLPKDWDIETDADGYTERGWIDWGFKTYYALLNCGFRLRPTGGTASGVHPVPLGFGRVYVHLPEGFGYDRWVEGLDRGRSFVTTGPMLFVKLDGKDPGHVFRRERQEKPEPREYHVTGSGVSPVPLGRIEVLVNGEVVRPVRPANRKTDRGAFESPIDEKVPLDGSSWLAVRCYEDRPDGRVRFAHSGPFHVGVPGRPLRPRKSEVEYLVRRGGGGGRGGQSGPPPPAPRGGAGGGGGGAPGRRRA